MRAFAYNIGVTKYNGLTDIAVLEHAIREDLNRTALRRLAVLRPIKVVITNYPEGQVEECAAVNNPEDPEAGTRAIPFTRELYIEQDDFMEVPPPKYFRLKPGGEVRLKYAYIIKCDEVVKDAAGERRGAALHRRSRQQERRPDRQPQGEGHDPLGERRACGRRRSAPLRPALHRAGAGCGAATSGSCLNPHSLEVVTAKCEPASREAKPELRYQFERLGYFALDQDSTPERLVFNRTITLKDAWAKEGKKG